jgi:prepilin-type processing-associated H-X9-DG protein
VSLLPQIEQQAIHDTMNFNVQGNKNDWGGETSTNLDLIKQNLPAVVCPSDNEALTPVETELSRKFWTGGEDEEVGLISYAANSGDHRNATGVGHPSADFPPWANDAYDASSMRGVIGRWNYSVDFREITDGTTHTYLYGEIIPSWCRWNAWGLQSWATTAHPLNSWNDTVRESDGWLADLCITFRSLHPGGAHFSMCDGSVQFVLDDIEHVLYRNFASRNGGEVPGLPQEYQSTGIVR